MSHGFLLSSSRPLRCFLGTVPSMRQYQRDSIGKRTSTSTFVGIFRTIATTDQSTMFMDSQVSSYLEQGKGSGNDCKFSPRSSSVIGRSIFLDHMAEHAPQFEFSFMPHESLVSFVLRSVGSGKDTWVPILLRTCLDQDGFTRFKGIKRKSPFFRTVGFEYSRRQMYLFPEDMHVDYVTFKEGNQRHERFKIPNHEINDFLNNYWEASEQRLRKDWIVDEIFPRKAWKVWAASLRELWRSFYDPCDMFVGFPSSGAPVNTLINRNIRILHHKVIIRNERRRIVYYGNLGRGVGLNKPPFSVHDDVHFYLFCIYESESTTVPGFYLFPKEYLADQGYLADPENGIPGKRVIMLYPPWCNPSFEWTKEKQKAHNQYFLSTQNEDEIRQSSNRFLQILESNSRGRSKTYSP